MRTKKRKKITETKILQCIGTAFSGVRDWKNTEVGDDTEKKGFLI